MTRPFSQCISTNAPFSALRRIALKITSSSTIRAPGYAMNILKLGEPSRTSSSIAGKNSSGRSVMIWCRPQSTTAFSSARSYHS